MTAAGPDLMAFLGTLGVTAAGAAAAAYALFKFLGDKWMSARFNERLESHKHAQQQELERLKLKINTLLDRATKLNNQEFEVLPEIWSKLNDAFFTVLSVASPLKKYPDLDRMGEGELEEYLKQSEMPEWEKAQVRSAQSKSGRYRAYRFWYDLKNASETFNAFRDYFVKKEIFLQADLKNKIQTLTRFMEDALVEQEVEERLPHPRPGRFEKSGRLRDEGKALLDEIGDDVQKRLWNARSID